jgi:hypothetical protein
MNPSAASGKEGGVRVVVRGERRIPEKIRVLAAMDDADYSDLCTVTTGGTRRSAEEWARTVVERVAGARAQFVWRVILGLRLEPRSAPGCIGGWRIADRGEGWVRCEARSWGTTAHILCYVDDRQVSVAVFARFDRPLAAMVFAPVGFGHRLVIPAMLHRAVREEQRRGPHPD